LIYLNLFELSGSLYAQAASALGKKAGNERRGDWMIWRKEKSLAPTGIQTPGRTSPHSSPVLPQLTQVTYCGL